MRYRRLGHTDLEVSVLGFGASPLGDVFSIRFSPPPENRLHRSATGARCGVWRFRADRQRDTAGSAHSAAAGKAHYIGITGYSLQALVSIAKAAPVDSMGILSPGGAPAWHPAPAAVRAAGRRAKQICKAPGLQVAEVALRFCLGHPTVASTLVGMSTLNQVEEN